MNTSHIVEAALFSAGRPLSIEEIVEETNLPLDEVKKAVKTLYNDYNERDSALEVGQAGSKWAMQVKSSVSEAAARFAPMEIPKKVLKTLALIAYHQPLKQSELKDMIGSKVYDHVGELVERGLVKARQDGITKQLTTTPAFPEYFGIPADDMQAVRGEMAKLVGLEAPTEKTEATSETTRVLESFAEIASGAAKAAVAQAEAEASTVDVADLRGEATEEPQEKGLEEPPPASN